MLSPSYTTIPVLILVFAIGATVLWLVANELGRRAGLPPTSRIVLAGGLGLGVLAVGIKVAIVATLSVTGAQTLAAAGGSARAAVNDWLPERSEDPDKKAPDRQASGFRTWRSLPTSARAPRDNPTTPEKVALGRTLFYDKNLSLDSSVSCATCHVLRDGGDDNRPLPTGVGGKHGTRNSPTVLNAAFLSRLFWDGRAPSLERQAEGPFVNPVEMAMPSLTHVEQRVRQNPEYQQEFAKIFAGPEPITIGNITRAIAAFERTLITPDTAYDRFVRGDDMAMSAKALRGMALFDEVGCRTCHVDPMFSAASTTKPLGVYRKFPVFAENNPFLDKYDLLVNGAPARYRVPSLRNIAQTGPYFHNGSVPELEEAIRIMAVSQLDRILSNDPRADIMVTSQPVDGDTPGRNLSMVRNRALSDAEVSDIAAFLRALSADEIPG